LLHVAGYRHYDVPAKWWYNRARAADRAARGAGHESPRTTKLYDRTNDAISLDERACPVVPGIERILI
jgi:hypothetical protein